MKHIVVLDRAWNLVGDLKKEDDDLYSMTNAFFIRRWGTTKGIGQLAIEGKLNETILDPTNPTKFHKDKVIFIIECNEKKWQ